MEKISENCTEALSEDALTVVCMLVRGIMQMRPSALLILQKKINKPGISNEEISAELKISKKTVQNLISAEEILRRML